MPDVEKVKLLKVPAIVVDVAKAVNVRFEPVPVPLIVIEFTASSARKIKIFEPVGAEIEYPKQVVVPNEIVPPVAALK